MFAYICVHKMNSHRFFFSLVLFSVTKCRQHPTNIEKIVRWHFWQDQSLFLLQLFGLCLKFLMKLMVFQSASMRVGRRSKHIPDVNFYFLKHNILLKRQQMMYFQTIHSLRNLKFDAFVKPYIAFANKN